MLLMGKLCFFFVKTKLFGADCVKLMGFLKKIVMHFAVSSVIAHTGNVMSQKSQSTKVTTVTN